MHRERRSGQWCVSSSPNLLWKQQVVSLEHLLYHFNAIVPTSTVFSFTPCSLNPHNNPIQINCLHFCVSEPGSPASISKFSHHNRTMDLWQGGYRNSGLIFLLSSFWTKEFCCWLSCSFTRFSGRQTDCISWICARNPIKPLFPVLFRPRNWITSSEPQLCHSHL